MEAEEYLCWVVAYLPCRSVNNQEKKARHRAQSNLESLSTFGAGATIRNL